uniref:Uncharacterized protein n=1 Tax=Salvator merianae TaxID=96440 RepID=A0A8D0CC53_SALMN
MTILCEKCRKPVKRQSCNFRCPTSSGFRQELRTSKTFRSTKGASKARRDLINRELKTLQSLLPISEQEKERLSYLHTMALICFYLRQTQLFPIGPNGAAESISPPVAATAPLIDPELLLSLPGFILVCTPKGKLVYVSENVSLFLGFSVTELLSHGDSIFDLFNSQACKIVREKLSFAQQHPDTDTEFIMEMRTLKAFRIKSGRNRSVSVRGRFLTLDGSLTSSALTFVAFCTPVGHPLDDAVDTSQNSSFQTRHALDMTIAEITDNVIYHLGYQREWLIGLSWYGLLHPEDAGKAAEMHRILMHGVGRHSQQAVVRLLCKDMSWIWAQVTALREIGEGVESITCTNHILREEEALYIQTQDPQYRVASLAVSNPQYHSGAIQQPTELSKPNLFPHDPQLTTNRALKDTSQLLKSCEEKVAPAFLQPLFPTRFPDSGKMVDPPVMQNPQERGLIFFPPHGSKFHSCPESANRLPSLSPYDPCSPESSFSSDGSPSVDLSPFFEQSPSARWMGTTDTESDPDKWSVSVLGQEIHSVTEICSPCTKETSQKIPTFAVWPDQMAEDSHLVPKESWETNGVLDFPEELPMNEEIIMDILNNLLDCDSLNLPTSELGTTNNLHISNTEFQHLLLQTPPPETTQLLSQCPFLQPLSSSVSSHSPVPDSWWDRNFHTVIQKTTTPVL